MLAKMRHCLPEYGIKKGDKLPIVDWSAEDHKNPRIYTVYKNGHKIDVGRSEIKIVEPMEV